MKGGRRRRRQGDKKGARQIRGRRGGGISGKTEGRVGKLKMERWDERKQGKKRGTVVWSEDGKVGGRENGRE